MQVTRPEGQKLARKKSLAVGEACMTIIIQTCSSLKRENSWALGSQQIGLQFLRPQYPTVGDNEDDDDDDDDDDDGANSDEGGYAWRSVKMKPWKVCHVPRRSRNCPTQMSVQTHTLVHYPGHIPFSDPTEEHAMTSDCYGVVPKELLTFPGFLGNVEFSPWKRLPELIELRKSLKQTNKNKKLQLFLWQPVTSWLFLFIYLFIYLFFLFLPIVMFLR